MVIKQPSLYLDAFSMGILLFQILSELMGLLWRREQSFHAAIFISTGINEVYVRHCVILHADLIKNAAKPEHQDHNPRDASNGTP